jgi:hypothetical protein
MTGREVISEVVVRALDGAKEQPDMRAAGRALGTSARILAETVRTALLPLAAVNIGVRKFEDYLRGKFADELDDATSSIPEDLLQEPPLNIAGPVMQGLSYTHESEQLRRMFLALLATSMDASREDEAHPAFADIVRQLAPDEASVLAALFRLDGGVDIVRYQKRYDNPRGVSVVQDNVLPLLTDTDRATLPGYVKIAGWVNNWVRLGLIEVDYENAFARPDRYLWVDDWPSTIALRAALGDALRIDKGAVTTTAWGRAFAQAVNAGATENSPYRFQQEGSSSAEDSADAEDSDIDAPPS